MKLRLAAVGLAALLLSACGYSHSTSSDMDIQPVHYQKTKAVDETVKHSGDSAASDKAAPYTLEGTADEPAAAPDKGLDAPVGQEIDIEAQLDAWTMEEWENTPLSREEFNQLLVEMIQGDDDTNPFSEIALLDDHTLKVVFNNTDGESLENMLFAPIFDGVLRSLYMRSSYYQNNQQPVIRFVDHSGKLVAENTNFANLDQP